MILPGTGNAVFDKMLPFKGVLLHFVTLTFDLRIRHDTMNMLLYTWISKHFQCL